MTDPAADLLGRLEGGDEYGALDALALLVSHDPDPAHQGWLTSIASIEAARDGATWLRRLALLALAGCGHPESIDTLGSLASAGGWPDGPVCMVVGTTDEAKGLGAVEAILEAGFEGYEGVVVSGGTGAGVAGIAGSVRRGSNDRVRAIGYVPSDAGEVSSDYDVIRRTAGLDFSPLESLQAWTDVVVAGVAASTVRVLGAGGGRISGSEYRIALALGARVGILQDAGRAGRRLLDDPDWAGCPQLIALPAHPEAVRAFLAARSA